MTRGAVAAANNGATNLKSGELTAGGRLAQIAPPPASLGVRSTRAGGRRSVRGKVAVGARPVRHMHRETTNLDCGVATVEDASHVISKRFYIYSDISFAIGAALFCNQVAPPVRCMMTRYQSCP